MKILANYNRSSITYDKKTEYIFNNLEPGFVNFENLEIEWRFKERNGQKVEICKHPK